MRWIEAAAALGMAAVAAGLGQSPASSQAPPAVQMPQSEGMPTVPAPVIPQPVQPPPFVVVVDAAHGGSDTGARLSGGIEEKEITLGIAARLRSTLRARGIVVVTTRQGDVNLMPVDRAQIANRAQGAACLTIHATATGSGVHLFTVVAEPDGEFAIFAVADRAVGLRNAEFEAGVGDRFGVGAHADSGESRARVGGADGQPDLS